MAFKPSARVIADSVTVDGDRLTTIEVIMHRWVLSEMNTHRAFCLAGDSVLEFDLPSGSSGSSYKKYTMTLEEFADKWFHGASIRKSKPKKQLNLNLIDPDQVYTGKELSELLGYSKSNIHKACRDGLLKAWKDDYTKGQGLPWNIRGSDFIDYWEQPQSGNRQSIQSRLKGMKIRQVNETTGDVRHSSVNNVFISGIKDVYTVRLADGKTISGSLDHRIFTNCGWRTIRELREGDFVAVRKYGKSEEDKLDSNRLRKLDGKWRAVWQRQMSEKFKAEDPMCRDCRTNRATDVAHIIPVHANTDLVFEESNVTYICKPCHQDRDRVQGWQEGCPIYMGFSPVVSIVFRGKEMTYDLEIAGEFPNFIANGIVVHNSRNSASSRAIPVRKSIESVEADGVEPLVWASEQKGMQGGEELDSATMWRAKEVWNEARESALIAAHKLKEIGVHKSIVNRILEPYLSHKVIVTGTDWSGFWEQRCSPLAQPEIRVAAEEMKLAYDKSTPELIEYGGWHLPYVLQSDRERYPDYLKEISTARCARVSYNPPDGREPNPERDIELYERLVSAQPPHWSPLEHVATPARSGDQVLGNFKGWIQLRHYI